VPPPERYALHKLIVSRRRRVDPAKIDKDIAQARVLLDVLVERRRADLRDAWAEARAYVFPPTASSPSSSSWRQVSSRSPPRMRGAWCRAAILAPDLGPATRGRTCIVPSD
jgi:hypothetical protein